MKPAMLIAVLLITFQLSCEAYEEFGFGSGDQDSCANGGIPSDGKYQKCACAYGYRGYDCSQKVRPCDAIPCRHSGECVEKDNNTFYCICPRNYRGVLCEEELTICDTNPCKNGGNCTNWFEQAFICNCPAGFKGFDCSKRVLACEISPCQNNGTCTNTEDGGFTCSCINGHAGAICTEKDDLHSSMILEGKIEYLEQLKLWLNNDKKPWQLCYRASQDGWASADFHSRCDFKGPTITIVRVGYYIFGGYSNIAWGGSSGYKKSTECFLFSFRNKDKLAPFKAPVYQNTQNAIYTNSGYGPTFGSGHDLYIKNKANVSPGSYSNLGNTYKLPSGYKYGSERSKGLLAGHQYFVPTDIEVFY